MVATASIKVNGVAGSNTDLPIATAVALANSSNTGVVTWLWELVSQPPGALDTLTTPTASSCAITLRKEGSYLVQLTVNKGEPDESVNRVVLAVRELKTRVRYPATAETTEVGAAGWASDVHAMLAVLARVASDPGLCVVVAAEALSAGDVVFPSDTATLKAGLPGEEVVPKVSKALASTAANVAGALGVVVGSVAGGGSVALEGLAIVRTQGLVRNLAGAPAVGDYVYVSDTAQLSLTVGTNARAVGTVARSDGGAFDVFVLPGIVEVTGGGGGGLPAGTNGGVLGFWSGVWQATGAGTAGEVLTSAGAGEPVWAAAPALPDGTEWVNEAYVTANLLGLAPAASSGDITAGFAFRMREERLITGARFYWAHATAAVVRVRVRDSGGSPIVTKDIAVAGVGMYTATFDTAVLLSPGAFYWLSTYETTGAQYTAAVVSPFSRDVPEFTRYFVRVTGYYYAPGDAQPITTPSPYAPMLLAPLF